MPPSYVINAIIWGILAAARARYRVRICHFVFLANHLHMILVVENPAHVPDFMRYVKSEITHAVNRLLGRHKKTIWEEGYDSPNLRTSAKVIHYIKYIYLNPSRAHLVDSIKEYPGVSSWEMFVNNIHKTQHARIPRPLIEPLYSPALSINEQRLLTSRWENLGLQRDEFILEPWAWVEAFPSIDIEACRSKILRDIEQVEQHYREKRRRKKRGVIGATALRRQSMTKEHTPKARGRRMIVICEDKELRKRFLDHFRALCKIAADAYESWKKGDFTPKIPPGMFAPRVPVLASALPV